MDWQEQVSDGQYGASAPAAKDAAGQSKGQTRAQKLFGEVGPKFTELTDDVP
jgi:hypothetical protein